MLKPNTSNHQRGHEVCPQIIASCETKGVNWRAEILNSQNTTLCEFCPFYAAILRYEMNHTNGSHMELYMHGHRPVCEAGRNCSAYRRCEENISDTKQDSCHMHTHYHPTRRSRDRTRSGVNPNKLPEGWNPVIFVEDFSIDSHTEWRQVLRQAKEDLSGFDNSVHAKFELIAIVCEVIENGFGMDLVKSSNSFTESRRKSKARKLTAYCAQLKRIFTTYLWFKRFKNAREMEDYLDGNFYIDTTLITLMSVVRDLMRRPRAKDCGITEAQTLSIVLYTGCDMNYELSRVMRLSCDEARKWPMTISVLSDAIVKLHTCDHVNQSLKSQGYLYSGVPRVSFPMDKFDENGVARGLFSCFTSTSRDMHVAERFRGDKGGLIMTITPRMAERIFSADVSWISKFPDERETLFCSWHHQIQRWKCTLQRTEISEYDAVFQYVILDVDDGKSDAPTETSGRVYLERILTGFDPTQNSLSEFDKSSVWQYRDSLTDYEGMLSKVLKIMDSSWDEENLQECEDLIMEWPFPSDLLDIASDPSFSESPALQFCRDRLKLLVLSDDENEQKQTEVEHEFGKIKEELASMQEIVREALAAGERADARANNAFERMETARREVEEARAEIQRQMQQHAEQQAQVQAELDAVLEERQKENAEFQLELSNLRQNGAEEREKHKEDMMKLQKDALQGRVEMIESLLKETERALRKMKRKHDADRDYLEELTTQTVEERHKIRHFAEEKSDPDVKTIVLLGMTGDGKSTLGNRLLGDQSEFGNGRFVTSHETQSETQWTMKLAETIHGQKISVMDTPGMADSSGKDREHINDVIQYLRGCGGVNRFLIVKNISNPRWNENYQTMLRRLEDRLTPEFWGFATVVLTGVEGKYARHFEKHKEDLVATLKAKHGCSDLDAVGIGIDDYEDVVQRLVCDIVGVDRFECESLISPLEELEAEKVEVEEQAGESLQEVKRIELKIEELTAKRDDVAERLHELEILSSI